MSQPSIVMSDLLAPYLTLLQRIDGVVFGVLLSIIGLVMIGTYVLHSYGHVHNKTIETVMYMVYIPCELLTVILLPLYSTAKCLPAVYTQYPSLLAFLPVAATYEYMAMGVIYSTTVVFCSMYVVELCIRLTSHTISWQIVMHHCTTIGVLVVANMLMKQMILEGNVYETMIIMDSSCFMLYFISVDFIPHIALLCRRLNFVDTKAVGDEAAAAVYTAKHGTRYWLKQIEMYGYLLSVTIVPFLRIVACGLIVTYQYGALSINSSLVTNHTVAYAWVGVQSVMTLLLLITQFVGTHVLWTLWKHERKTMRKAQQLHLQNPTATSHAHGAVFVRQPTSLDLLVKPMDQNMHDEKQWHAKQDYVDQSSEYNQDNMSNSQSQQGEAVQSNGNRSEVPQYNKREQSFGEPSTMSQRQVSYQPYDRYSNVNQQLEDFNIQKVVYLA